ncbi:hypothetical protein BDV40DRAFT_271672, partial [Aspergillus tamarii]
MWMKLTWTRNTTNFKSPIQNVISASMKRYTARSRQRFESPPSKRFGSRNHGDFES